MIMMMMKQDMLCQFLDDFLFQANTKRYNAMFTMTIFHYT